MVEDDLYSQKRALREEMRRRRVAAANKSLPEGSGALLRDQFLRNVSLPAGSVVAMTIPQDGEIDPGPLGEALLAAGHRLCLPRVACKGLPLVFKSWSLGDELRPGAFGIPEPLVSAAEVLPGFLLVPFLAFDRHGNRLGQGGGYYDRTLATLRAQGEVLAAGLGFSAQEVPAVPAGPGDERLDCIVTEKEFIVPHHFSALLKPQ